MSFRNPLATLAASAITGQLTGAQIAPGAVDPSKVSFTADAIGGETPAGAQAKVDAYKAADQSKGSNLITNGTGFLGNNTNFTGFTFDPTDSPVGSAGCFVTAAGNNSPRFTDEFLPVDPNKRTRLQFAARQRGTTAGGYMYGYFAPYDDAKQAISAYHYMYIPGTLTTLAAPLHPGDTTITLTSSAGWYGSAANPAGASVQLRNLIFWDYVDANGRAWPAQTYSRNVLMNGTAGWADGGLVGNVITLSAPYAGPAKAAGTQVSNANSGGTFLYMPSVQNIVIPKTWTTYGDTVVANGSGTGGAGANFLTGWPYGTAYCQPGWLVNRSSTGPADPLSQHAVALVAAGETVAALYDANNITTTQITPGAITTPLLAAGAVITAKLAAGAVTANELAAGAVTAAKIVAGAIDGMTITGALIRTAAAGKRWELKSAAANTLSAYSGLATETAPGYLRIDTDVTGVGTQLDIAPGTVSGNPPPYISLQGFDAGSGGGLMTLSAPGGAVLNGPLTVNAPIALDTAWTTVSAFFTGWVNYGAGHRAAQYRKMPDGSVMVRGLVKSGSVGGIINLPAGYRPSLTEMFVCQSNTGTARVDVGADGSVSLIGYGTGGSNTFVSLAGIRFYPD